MVMVAEIVERLWCMSQCQIEDFVLNLSFSASKSVFLFCLNFCSVIINVKALLLMIEI